MPQLALITGCAGVSSFFNTPCSTSFWIKPVSCWWVRSTAGMLMATAQLLEALGQPNAWVLRRLKFIADNQ